MSRVIVEPPLGPPATFLARALDSVAEAVIITDLTGRVVYWNRAATSVYGFTAAEAMHQLLDSMIVPVAVRDRGREVLSSVVDDGTPYVGEWSMQDRAGRRFPVQVATSVIRDEHGEPTHVIGVSTDVTGQRESSHRSELLAAIVDTSTDGIYTTDTDGVVTWANAATAQVLGWSPPDLVGLPQAVLVPEEQRAEQRARFEGVLRGDRPPSEQTLRLRRDGTPVLVSIAVSPLTDDQGEVTGVGCVVRDLSEHEALQRDIRRHAARFRARFDQSSVAQSMLDLSGRLVSVNDAYCRLVDRTRDELLGLSPTAILHPSDGGMGAPAFAKLLSGERSAASYERIIAHRDGHPIPLLVNITVLEDPDDGAPYAMAASLLDLTAVRAAERRSTKQQALFDALSRRSSDVATVTDADGQIVYVSPSVTDIFGYEPADVLAMSGSDFIHVDDQEAVLAVQQRVRATSGRMDQCTVRMRDGHGLWRWVEMSGTNMLSDPDIGGVVTNLRDVTAQVEAQAELRRSEARYRTIAETAQEGIAVLTVSGDVTFANQKLADILGLTLEETYRGAGHSRPNPLVAEGDARLRLWHPSGPETYQLPYRHPDGSEHVLAVSSAPMSVADDGQPHALAMVSDVTEEQRARSELLRRALYDGLTGLPNRALFTDRVTAALSRLGQEAGDAYRLAVLCVDLDRFRLVNHSRGHDVGDVLLCEVARRLTRVARPGDTVARLGGDEFAVLLESTDEGAATSLAEQIRWTLSEPVVVEGQRLYVGASIGVAHTPSDDPLALMRSADDAMFEAKRQGRGRVKVFDSALSTGAERRLAVGSALREAVAHDTLSLSYQPVVDLGTGELTGVEALLRWTDDLLGPVSPVEVVSVADEMGWARILDEWVIRRACSDFTRRRPPGLPAGCTLAVNVSARHLSGMALDALVATVLAETGFPGEQLTLEVTESAIMADVEGAATLLLALGSRGVRIAIDDFGTGYSSLAYLKRLPVHVVKIDMAFVEHVTVDADSLAIAASIVDLASALGLSTVAEGIETAEQAVVMQGLGCTRGQGYLWSPAMPLEQLTAGYSVP